MKVLFFIQMLVLLVTTVVEEEAVVTGEDALKTLAEVEVEEVVAEVVGTDGEFE